MAIKNLRESRYWAAYLSIAELFTIASTTL
jgi:hypothetical protein